jgi:hypothetical protein
MKKLVLIHFWSLPNAAHFAFYSERFIPAITTSGDAVLAMLKPLLPELEAAFAKASALMEWQRRSEFTELVFEADGRVDHQLSAMGAQVNVNRYSDDPDTLTAANRISLMLKNYGNVARKPYEAEVGDVRAILSRLNGDLAPDVATIGIAATVAKLQAAFAEFNALFDARNTQAMQKPDTTFREVWRDLDGSYHLITAQLEANALVGTSPDFAALIAKLNPEIEYLNTAFHRTAKKVSIEGAQIDPVAPQTYTGLAITPTPRVFLPATSGGTELVLGKDFIFIYFY